MLRFRETGPAIPDPAGRVLPVPPVALPERRRTIRGHHAAEYLVSAVVCSVAGSTHAAGAAASRVESNGSICLESWADRLARRRRISANRCKTDRRH